MNVGAPCGSPASPSQFHVETPAAPTFTFFFSFHSLSLFFFPKFFPFFFPSTYLPAYLGSEPIASLTLTWPVSRVGRRPKSLVRRARELFCLFHELVPLVRIPFTGLHIRPLQSLLGLSNSAWGYQPVGPWSFFLNFSLFHLSAIVIVDKNQCFFLPNLIERTCYLSPRCFVNPTECMWSGVIVQYLQNGLFNIVSFWSQDFIFFIVNIYHNQHGGKLSKKNHFCSLSIGSIGPPSQHSIKCFFFFNCIATSITGSLSNDQFKFKNLFDNTTYEYCYAVRAWMCVGWRSGTYTL